MPRVETKLPNYYAPLRLMDEKKETQELNPTSAEIWRAGREQENEVYGFIDLMKRQEPPPEEGFDLIAEAKKRNVDPSEFVNVLSTGEFDQRIARAQRERRNQEVLDAGGVEGLLARVAWGVASPTSLIPLWRGVTGTRSILAGAASVLTGAAVQEGILYGAQETRTAGEVTFSLAASTIIGGVLGGIVHTMSKSAVDKIAHDMANSLQELTILPPPKDSTAGAAEFSGIEDVGSMKKGWGADKLAFLSPITRGFQQWNAPAYLATEGGSAQLRKMTAGFSQAGLALQDNVKFRAAVSGGNVEDLKRTYAAVGYAARIDVDKTYIEYILGTQARGPLKRSRALVQGYRADGKLNYDEFKRQITIDIWSNFTREGVDPYVRKAAKLVDDRVYKKLYEEGVAAKLFTGEEKTIGDENYANRVYNNEVIMRRHEEFVSILAKNYSKQLNEQFSKGYEKLRERMAKDKVALEDAQRPLDEVLALREEIKAQAEVLEKNTSLDVLEGIDTVKGIRNQVKALTKELEELKKVKTGADVEGLRKRQDRMAEIEAQIKAKAVQAEDTKKALGEGLDNYTKAVSEIRRRLAGLSRAHVMQDARMQRKLEKIEANEDAQVQTILRAQKQLMKFVKMLDSATAEKIDEAASKLKDKFNEQAERLGKLEQKLNELETGEEPKFKRPEKIAVPKSYQVQVQKRIEALNAYESAKGQYDLMTARKEQDKEAIEKAFAQKRKGNISVSQILGTFDVGQEARDSLKPAVYKKRVMEALEQKYKNAEDDWAKAQTEYKKAGSPDPEIFDEVNAEHQAVDEIVGSNFWGAMDQVGVYSYDGTRSALRQSLDDYYQNMVDTMHEKFGPDNKSVWAYADQEWSRLEEFALKQEQANPDVVPRGERAAKDAGLPPEMVLSDKMDSVAAKMDELAEKIEKLDAYDAEAFKLEIDDMMRELADTHAKINAKRAVRNEKLWKQVDNYSPEARAKRLEEMKLKAANRPKDFTARWNTLAKGDLMAGVADFNEVADERAREVVKKILGINNRLAYSDIIQQERGPELARLLNISSEEIADFLETDIDHLVSIYTRTVGSDLAIAEVFGTADAAEAFQKLDLERNDIIKKIKEIKGKDGTAISKEEMEKLEYQTNKFYENGRRDLLVLLERAKGVRGLPRDPDAWSSRAAKTVMDINYLRFMGGVVINSIADLARPVMRHGLTRTFKDGIIPMVRAFRTIRMSQREAKLAGTALDVVMHTRAMAMMDMFDDAYRGTKVEKGIHYLSTRMGTIALFDQWTSAMKEFSAGIVNARLMDSIAIVNGEKATAKEIRKAQEFLAKNNIDAELAQTIWLEVTNGKGGGKVNGIWLPNTEFWNIADPNVKRAQRAYRAALAQEVDSTIITPGFERPNWVDMNVPARMLAQFKSFGFSSTQKTLMAGLQEHDAAFLNGVMLSLGLGVVSYYLWANTVGGKAKEKLDAALADLDGEGWKILADEAITRSGVLGVFADVQKFAHRVPVLRQYASLSGAESTRRAGGDMTESLLGPSFDLLERATQVLAGIDEPTKSTLHSARLMMPLQNIFYLRQLLDMVEAAIDLPERREAR